MSLASILPDAEALIQIKEGSRKLYIKAFNGLRKHLGNDLETRPPSEEELLSYFKFLRPEKGLASSPLWTTYSQICNSSYLHLDIGQEEDENEDIWDEWNPTSAELK